MEIEIEYFSYVSGKIEIRHFDYVREARKWIEENEHYIDIYNLKWKIDNLKWKTIRMQLC